MNYGIQNASINNFVNLFQMSLSTVTMENGDGSAFPQTTDGILISQWLLAHNWASVTLRVS